MVASTVQSLVRRAEKRDIGNIARINLFGFSGNNHDIRAAEQWVASWLGAYPLYQYFVLVVEGKVAGYIGWQIHGGFRRQIPVVELEQIALDPKFQRKGLSSPLIKESEKQVFAWMREDNPDMQEAIAVVWAYDDNSPALALYRKWFPDGVVGARTQYSGKMEIMLRKVLVP